MKRSMIIDEACGMLFHFLYPLIHIRNIRVLPFSDTGYSKTAALRGWKGTG